MSILYVVAIAPVWFR